MRRSPIVFATALALALVPASALASHTDAEVSITSASSIFVSVNNLSGSSDVNERLLTMTTPAEITVKGDAGCHNGAGLESVQLHFGLDYIESGPNGHTLWGVWDSSAPVNYQSWINASWSITHEVDLGSTWELGTLVTLRPNAVKVVEDNLAAYVNGGGSAIDFLRTDGAFETTVTAYATAACMKNGNVTFDTVGRTVTMHVLYKGDPNIEVQTVGNNPDTLAPNQPPSQPVFAFYVPQLKGAISLGFQSAVGGARAPVRGGDDDVRDPIDGGGDDVREPLVIDEDDDGERLVEFASFPIYDIDEDAYTGRMWSGYVSTWSDEVCGEPQMAVTGDGSCVHVDEGCLPAEFESCDVLDGCCDGL